MTTLTCDHCDSEIDVAKDPRCVVYDPSGATDVICENCRQIAWELRNEKEPPEAYGVGPCMHEIYRIKREWRN